MRILSPKQQMGMGQSECSVPALKPGVCLHIMPFLWNYTCSFSGLLTYCV